MSKLNVLDFVKLTGFVVLVGATFSATVIVPSIEQQISDQNEKLADLRERRATLSTCVLNYAEQFTRRRIELFEANQLQLSGASPDLVQHVRERALDQTIALAKQWAFLLAGDAAEQKVCDVEKRASSVLNDPSIDISDKIDGNLERRAKCRIVASRRNEQGISQHQASNWNSSTVQKPLA